MFDIQSLSSKSFCEGYASYLNEMMRVDTQLTEAVNKLNISDKSDQDEALDKRLDLLIQVIRSASQFFFSTQFISDPEVKKALSKRVVEPLATAEDHLESLIIARCFKQAKIYAFSREKCQLNGQVIEHPHLQKQTAWSLFSHLTASVEKSRELMENPPIDRLTRSAPSYFPSKSEHKLSGVRNFMIAAYYENLCQLVATLKAEANGSKPLFRSIEETLQPSVRQLIQDCIETQKSVLDFMEEGEKQEAQRICQEYLTRLSHSELVEDLKEALISHMNVLVPPTQRAVQCSLSAVQNLVDLYPNNKKSFPRAIKRARPESSGSLRKKLAKREDVIVPSNPQDAVFRSLVLSAIKLGYGKLEFIQSLNGTRVCFQKLCAPGLQKTNEIRILDEIECLLLCYLSIVDPLSNTDSLEANQFKKELWMTLSNDLALIKRRVFEILQCSSELPAPLRRSAAELCRLILQDLGKSPLEPRTQLLTEGCIQVKNAGATDSNTINVCYPAFMFGIGEMILERLGPRMPVLTHLPSSIFLTVPLVNGKASCSKDSYDDKAHLLGLINAALSAPPIVPTGEEFDQEMKMLMEDGLSQEAAIERFNSKWADKLPEIKQREIYELFLSVFKEKWNEILGSVFVTEPEEKRFEKSSPGTVHLLLSRSKLLLLKAKLESFSLEKRNQSSSFSSLISNEPTPLITPLEEDDTLVELGLEEGATVENSDGNRWILAGVLEPSLFPELTEECKNFREKCSSIDVFISDFKEFFVAGDVAGTFVFLEDIIKDHVELFLLVDSLPSSCQEQVAFFKDHMGRLLLNDLNFLIESIQKNNSSKIPLTESLVELKDKLLSQFSKGSHDFSRLSFTFTEVAAEAATQPGYFYGIFKALLKLVYMSGVDPNFLVVTEDSLNGLFVVTKKRTITSEVSPAKRPKEDAGTLLRVVTEMVVSFSQKKEALLKDLSDSGLEEDQLKQIVNEQKCELSENDRTLLFSKISSCLTKKALTEVLKLAKLSSVEAIVDSQALELFQKALIIQRI